MIRKEIDKKYIDQANALEVETFDVVDKGLPSQHRVLKNGKSMDEFTQRHAEIWSNHIAELKAEGLMKTPISPEPVRDPLAEIDDLRAKLMEKAIL